MAAEPLYNPTIPFSFSSLIVMAVAVTLGAAFADPPSTAVETKRTLAQELIHV